VRSSRLVVNGETVACLCVDMCHLWLGGPVQDVGRCFTTHLHGLLLFADLRFCASQSLVLESRVIGS
jgi:hypothetical protein